mgnify:CR=1 FL=1
MFFSCLTDMFSLLRKGWLAIWAELILFIGSHRKQSPIKLRASLGQFGITVDRGIYGYSGIPIPFFAACFTPSGQLLPGDPKTETILLIWSIYELPRKIGLPRYISAKMHPTAQTSTGAEYEGNLNSISGERYHLVETYSVNGGLLRISLAIPKSISFTVRSGATRRF